MEDNNQHIKTTKEGRLYIKNNDFFQQEKIRDMVDRLLSSPITKNIDKRNKNGLKSA